MQLFVSTVMFADLRCALQERVRIAHERDFKCALNDASVAIVVMVAHHCYNAPFRDELR